MPARKTTPRLWSNRQSDWNTLVDEAIADQDRRLARCLNFLEDDLSTRARFRAVYRALLRPGEHSGFQPSLVLVVQADELNKRLATTVVVRLTTNAAGIPEPQRAYAAEIQAAETGLERDAYALCTDVITIPQRRCVSVGSMISPDCMRAVMEMLARVLAIR